MSCCVIGPGVPLEDPSPDMAKELYRIIGFGGIVPKSECVYALCEGKPDGKSGTGLEPASEE